MKSQQLHKYINQKRKKIDNSIFSRSEFAQYPNLFRNCVKYNRLAIHHLSDKIIKDLLCLCGIHGAVITAVV